MRYLRSVLDANEPACHAWTAGEALGLFIGQLSRANESYGTVKLYLDYIERFHIDPLNPEASLERIQRSELRSGLDRATRMQGPLKSKTPCPLADLPLPLRERDDDTDIDRDYQALWYLVVATGSRPANLILGAGEVTVGDAHVRVKWLHRKRRRGAHAHVGYAFEWSDKPSPRVCRRLEQLPDRSWLFADSTNISSALGSWIKSRLKKAGCKRLFTPKAARDRLSSILLQKYEEGEISKEKYECLMDHEVETAQQHYAHEI